MTRLARLRSIIQAAIIILVIVATGFMYALVATADTEPVTCRPFVVHTVESSQK